MKVVVTPNVPGLDVSRANGGSRGRLGTRNRMDRDDTRWPRRCAVRRAHVECGCRRARRPACQRRPEDSRSASPLPCPSPCSRPRSRKSTARCRCRSAAPPDASATQRRRAARRHCGVVAVEALRRHARRAPLVRTLSVQLPRTADLAGHRSARSRRNGRRWWRRCRSISTATASPTTSRPSDDSRSQGSPTLTAYLLAVSDEASKLDPRFALPDDVRGKLEAGLVGFVEGRIERNAWAPRKDLDLRKLAALEALSRYGMAQPRMLGSIEIAPNQWPTSAVLDYYAILSRVPDIPQRDDKRAQLEQILRARLTYQGTRLTFSTEADDDLWWLMTGTEDNAARTALHLRRCRPRGRTRCRASSRACSRCNATAHGRRRPRTCGARSQSSVSRRCSKARRSPDRRGCNSVRSTRRSRGVRPAPPAASSADTPPRKPTNTRSQLLPWPPANQGTATPLTLTHDGTGKPWATIESLAAVPLKAPFAAGYRITKTVTPLDPAVKGVYTRGDVVRVHLDIDAQTDMTWVVVNDPVPAGATILGSGLGRDSEAATRREDAETTPTEARGRRLSSAASTAIGRITIICRRGNFRSSTRCGSTTSARSVCRRRASKRSMRRRRSARCRMRRWSWCPQPAPFLRPRNEAHGFCSVN